MNTLKFDDVDRRIVSLITQFPELKQDEIASRLNYAQSTVSARIGRLKKEGIIKLCLVMNASKLGLHMLRVDLMTSQPTTLLGLFKNCPCFINSYQITGKYNLSMLFVSETLTALEALVNMHLRSRSEIKTLESYVISQPAYGNCIVLNQYFEKNDKTPCGVRCQACLYYKDGGCPGCPATYDYIGNLWNKQK